MFGLGPGELVLVLILVLIFYGGKKLPAIGEGLGKSITEFRNSIRSNPDPSASKGSSAPPELKRADGNTPREAGAPDADRIAK